MDWADVLSELPPSELTCGPSFSHRLGLDSPRLVSRGWGFSLEQLSTCFQRFNPNCFHQFG